MDYRRQVIEQGLKAGSSARKTRSFSQAEVESFAALSGDFNPYHFESNFSTDGRFGKPIVHGLLVASMLTEIGGQWAWLATEMNFRFLAPVYAGDSVTIEVKVISLDERNFAQAEARWVNQDGTIVIEGKLAGFPPDAGQRRLLDGAGKSS